MITGFDHVVIAVRDLAAGVTAYELLLGLKAACAEEHDGVATALITSANLSVELMAPVGASESARRLQAALDEGGEGLKSLVFATDDIERAHQRAERVNLAPEAIATRAGWRSFRISTERTHGVRLFVMQREAPLPVSPAQPESVLGLDHVVVRSPDAERAAALYGARLGLDMRLEREVRRAKLMFFRCGDAIVELVHDVSIEDGRDRLWGLSWRVNDADAAHARLAASGLDVSEVRQGIKPGTRVFTVRTGALGVPTLMLERSPR